AWHRYNGDGYGEHEDGAPFDGTGVGRAWPLLTGERAHYELAAGRWSVAERLLGALEAFANESGLLSEQLWDAPDIPERGLFFDRRQCTGAPTAGRRCTTARLGTPGSGSTSWTYRPRSSGPEDGSTSLSTGRRPTAGRGSTMPSSQPDPGRRTAVAARRPTKAWTPTPGIEEPSPEVAERRRRWSERCSRLCAGAIL